MSVVLYFSINTAFHSFKDKKMFATVSCKALSDKNMYGSEKKVGKIVM